MLGENWDSLPSVLLLGIGDAFDSEDILNDARATQRDIIEIHLPDANLNEAEARKHLDLSFDFPRNPRLVAMYHPYRGILTLRRQFLLDVSGQIPRVRSVAVAGRLSFDDLMKPDPLHVALAEFCNTLRRIASSRGLEFRDLEAA